MALGSFLVLSTFNVEKTEAVVTHPLNYNLFEGDGALSGSITFDETSVQTGAFVTDLSWITSLTITYTPAVGAIQNFSKSDYAAIRFIPTGTPDYSEGRDLVSQFSDINFLAATGGVPSAGDQSFEMNFDTNEYLLASTPSPLPLLSLIPIVLFTRKFSLKRKFDS